MSLLSVDGGTLSGLFFLEPEPEPVTAQALVEALRGELEAEGFSVLGNEAGPTPSMWLSECRSDGRRLGRARRGSPGRRGQCCRRRKMQCSFSHHDQRKMPPPPWRR